MRRVRQRCCHVQTAYRSWPYATVGVMASLSFRNLIAVTARLWGKVFRDQFCRNSPMLSPVNGGDPRVYGGVGGTFKF